MWPFKYTAKWLATILQWWASIGFQIKLFRSPIQLFHTICLVRLDDWIANELGWLLKQKHTLESKTTKKELTLTTWKSNVWKWDFGKSNPPFSKHCDTIIIGSGLGTYIYICVYKNLKYIHDIYVQFDHFFVSHCVKFHVKSTDPNHVTRSDHLIDPPHNGREHQQPGNWKVDHPSRFRGFLGGVVGWFLFCLRLVLPVKINPCIYWIYWILLVGLHIYSIPISYQ